MLSIVLMDIRVISYRTSGTFTSFHNISTALFEIFTSHINHMRTAQRRIKEKTLNVSQMCV
jgi:hypothetical protein